MFKKFAAIFVLLCVSITIFAVRSNACTIFNATEGNTTLIGNNEDWEDKNAYVWFEPSSNGKYGAVYFGFGDKWPQGGMNDRGLTFDWVMSKSEVTPLPYSKDKLNFSGCPSARILEQCTTVDEAVKMYEKYNEPAFGYCKAMYIDRMGNSALISCDEFNNKLIVEKKEFKYQIYGYGEGALISRLSSDQYSVTFSGFREMLSVASNNTTVYSNIYDSSKLELYLFYQHNYDKFVKFDLSNELKKGKHTIEIASLFSDISYSEKTLETDKPANNESVIKKTEEEKESPGIQSDYPKILMISGFVILAFISMIVVIIRNKRH